MQKQKNKPSDKPTKKQPEQALQSRTEEDRTVKTHECALVLSYDPQGYLGARIISPHAPVGTVPMHAQVAHQLLNHVQLIANVSATVFEGKRIAAEQAAAEAAAEGAPSNGVGSMPEEEPEEEPESESEDEEPEEEPEK